jgi:hypothetical protein
MAKNKIQLLGMKIEEFENYLNPKHEVNKVDRVIIGQKARLIPTFKRLDELSLASVFLATLPLVKEFRELVIREIGITRAGQLRAYTEVSFPNFKIYEDRIVKKGPLRIDGLLVQVIGGQIRDAAFFEMKKGTQEVYPEQINAYIDLAKMVDVPKIVSISNQFVPSSTDYPIEISNNKSVSLFHFSWRYIIALGSILLTDNDLNIADPDQVLIMKEVMEFLRDPNVEAKTFDMMSKEWVDVMEGVLADSDFSRKHHSLITQAVQDWIQEEQDLALKLSDELGTMVDCNIKRCKNMMERIEREADNIAKNLRLNSEFKFPNVVSPLSVTLDLGKRRLFCEVEVKVPSVSKADLNNRSQIGKQIRFVTRQLTNSKKRNEVAFQNLESSLYLTVQAKGRKAKPCRQFKDSEELIEESLGREFDSIQISCQKQFGKLLTNRRNFITEYEGFVRTFYGVVVQFLENYKEETIKIKVESVEENKEKEPEATN